MTVTGMQALRLLFSPAGRLPPQTFILFAVFVYLAGAASHLLTMPDVIARAGLWPFIAAQALLIWIWFTLHAKRLRDSGRSVGLAAGVSVLYALSIALLIIITASFYDLAWVMVAILLLIAFVPIVLALAVTLWAAARPGIEEEQA